jgi:hypothetical protein
MRPSIPLVVAALATALACSSGGSKSSSCDPVAQTGCKSPQVCANVSGTSPACVDAVVVSGVVYDLSKTPASGGISGAQLVALDANEAPTGSVASSDPTGAYALQVPADRDASGAPVASAKVTLHAAARGWQDFPGGTRVAVPVPLSTAVHQNGQWVVNGALTQVALAKLSDTTLTASLHGTVAVPPSHAGVLVVADRTVSAIDPTGATVSLTQGSTAIADASGHYEVLNLAPATYTVRAFSQGSSFEHKDQILVDGQDAQVDLARLGDATAKVTGGVQAVGSASGATSIILAVRSTFDDPFGTGLSLGRAAAVPGLRAALASVSDNATISGVPDGDYVVLAAFENDGLVRQVSGQGGTAPVFLTVAGADASFASPKIVSAVTLLGPGADPTATTPPAVAAPLDFTWSYGNASATKFDIRLYDAYGDLVWSVPSPLLDATGAFNAAAAFNGPCNGASGCTFAYNGPALTPGMTYQARITGWGTNSSKWVPESRTEDLLGIFTWQP